MSIMAVSGVKLTNNAYNTVFTGKRRNTENEVVQRDGGSNAMKRVPVVVMLAMSPAMLNSSVPEQYMPMNAQELTEVVAQIPAEDAATIDFAQVQQTKQSPFPKIAYFNERSSVFIKDVVSATGNKVPVKIVLTGYNPGKDVDIVHYIEDDYEDADENSIPPWIYELVYHDLGSDKEFLGAKIKQNFYDPKTGKYKSAMIREVRLDDVSAQYLLDLTTGDTKWTDKSRIAFSITKDSNKMPTKVLD